MRYRVAEKFKSIQGEGVYAGTPMAFIRFVGCSVGKRICQHCDTDFDEEMLWRGGGEFSDLELARWTEGYQHVCFTGGEPLDQNLEDLLDALFDRTGRTTIHVETSGTRDVRRFINQVSAAASGVKNEELFVCVSPKPGWSEESIVFADEVKVIVPGLGELTASLKQKLHEYYRMEGHALSSEKVQGIDNLRWPTLEDALRWAQAGKTVFLQPRNAKNDVDKQNLLYVQDIIRDHPELRLSVQLHKILKVQ